MTRTALPLPHRRLLTTEEAASYCGVSAPTMKAHVRVKPVKIGNSVRYDVKELDRWLDNKSKSGPVSADDWLELLDETHGARA